MSMRDIIRDVAHEHGVSPADILSPSRKRVIAMARREAYWRCYETRWPDGRRRYSQPMIGAAFNRDHSTVCHGLQRYEQERVK